MTLGTDFFRACLRAACALVAFNISGTAVAQDSRAVQVASATSSANVVLVGKIVTMNAARDVFKAGALWIQRGQIVAVAGGLSELDAAVQNITTREDAGVTADEFKSAQVVNVNGVIYPGMIDLHNHPDYAIYPLLPLKRKYKDRYEWRFYDDAYARRITNLNTLLNAPQYLDLATEVGRYGEIKALIGGTTSMQGSRPTLPSAKDECLVRNIETANVTPRPAFSRVDIGRDAAEWQRMVEERKKGPLVVHLAEGVGPRMSAEFDAVKRSGLLGPELVAIHGVGLTGAQFQELAAAGGKLVWSPLSNFMLYGQTADVEAAHRAGVLVSLAPDWGPSGSKSILGELKVADLVNRHQLKRLFSDRDLVEMVTVNPAKAIGWEQRLGQIASGYLADLVVVDDRHTDVYRNLVEAVEADIKLVVIRGDAIYGDAAIIGKLRAASELEPVVPAKLNSTLQPKRIVSNCPGTALPPMGFAEVSRKIQRALDLKFADVSGRVSADQMNKDLALCPVNSAVIPAQSPPSAADAKRFLACRFQLPFERTVLSPLATADDPQFFPRLLANPNLPRLLARLPKYYSRDQGAKRSTNQAAP